MRSKRSNNTGQAAAELAIFATLILLAFSVVLMYGQRLELQQQTKMEAFRLALQKAYEKNSSVSYTLKKDVRLFNLFGGYGQGQASSIGARASVMWQKGASGAQDAKDEQQFAFYQVNDEIIGSPDEGLPRYKKFSYGYDSREQEIKVPVEVFKEAGKKQESYSSTLTKDEVDSGITNTRSAQLQETVYTKLHVRFDETSDQTPWDNPPPPVYVYENLSYSHEGKTYTIGEISPVSQGAYFDDSINRVVYGKGKEGTVIQRQRTWATSND